MDDYSPIEDAQASATRMEKNWESDEILLWKLWVVQHCKTGILPFGVVVLRGDFGGKLTLAIEERDADTFTQPS